MAARRLWNLLPAAQNPNNLLNRTNNAVVFNAIPWHLRNQNIAHRRNLNELLNSTRSYNAIREELPLLYEDNIEDVDMPREIRENIDHVIAREMSASLDRSLSRGGYQQYVPVNLSSADLRTLMLDDNDEERTSNEFIDQFNEYLNRTFGHRVNLDAQTTDIIKHYYTVFKNRRRQELENSIMAGINRPRYNIMLFPLGTGPDNRFEWHMLFSVPIFNVRHLIELRHKVFEMYMAIIRTGSAANTTFSVDTMKFYIYQRPYSSSQIFHMNNLLTVSASLVSPTFPAQPDVVWQRWIDDLSEWFRINGQHINQDDFNQQFAIEINVDQRSYVRLNELFDMMQALFRDNPNRPHSNIFVVDIGMSSSILPPSSRLQR